MKITQAKAPTNQRLVYQGPSNVLAPGPEMTQKPVGVNLNELDLYISDPYSQVPNKRGRGLRIIRAVGNVSV